MATAVESTFIVVVLAAENTRQAAKATAFAAYGFVAANLATYKAALAAADVAYLTAVNTARNTAGLVLGTIGDTGPIQGNIASIVPA
jgi:hypothetical protein